MPLQCEDRYVNPACAPGYLRRRLHADHADALPARGRAAVARRSTRSRPRAPTAQEARLLGIERRRALPGRGAAHREPRRADHAGAAGASGQRATSSKGSSGHDAWASDRRWPTTPPAALAQRRRRHARAAGLARRPATGSCGSASPRSRRDGPFSAYPGVERWFAVLDGRRRRADDRRQRARAAAPAMRRCRSTASAPIGCRLLDGPTRDLNLMLRGDAGAAMRAGLAGDAWAPPAPPLRSLCAGRRPLPRRRDDDRHAGRHAWPGSAEAPAALSFQPRRRDRDAASPGWWLAAGAEELDA